MPLPTHQTTRPHGSVHFAIIAAAVVAAPFPVPAGAEPLSAAVTQMADPWQSFINEAAARFAIPASWIRAVITIESRGNAKAVSPKGAIGLMQIMPRTYAALRVRYGLGSDPADPYDNILAGAAYLREMRDRFGMPGFMAAYNAGPQRYEEYLSSGRPLPDETLTYVTQLAALLSGVSRAATLAVPNDHIFWRQAPLFVATPAGRFVDTRSAFAPQQRLVRSDRAIADPSALVPLSSGLFVRKSNSRGKP